MRLERMGAPAETLLPLIQGTSERPLAGLISGSLDIDKLDYLSRDAWMCGVPYGVIDVERLLTSLTYVAERPTGRRLALHEKGLSALESLLFAKYQMYRNVYWHHAVRSATAMFKRLVLVAIATGRVRQEDVALATDDGLIHELQRGDATGLAQALRERRLAKRALDIPAPDLPLDTADVARQRSRTVRARGRHAGPTSSTWTPGELFLDFPAKPDMLALDIPLVKRDGSVTQLSGDDATAHSGCRGLPESCTVPPGGCGCSPCGRRGCHAKAIGGSGDVAAGKKWLPGSPPGEASSVPSWNWLGLRRSAAGRVNGVDPHHDRRDVVEPAVAVCFVDEVVHHLLR